MASLLSPRNAPVLKLKGRGRGRETIERLSFHGNIGSKGMVSPSSLRNDPALNLQSLRIPAIQNI